MRHEAIGVRLPGLLILVAALGQFALPMPVGAGVRVRVPAEAVVTADEIVLGDLAAIDGDEDLARRLRQVRLGPAPPPGGSQTIDPSYLRMRLGEPQLEPGRVELHLPDQIVVTRASQVLSGPALVEAASRQIQERLSSLAPTSDPYAIVALNRPGDLQVPAGAVEIVAHFQVEPPVPSALAATVTVKVGGRTYHTIPLSFRIGRYQSVVVAAQSLEATAALGPGDWRVERRSSTEIPAGAMSAIPDSADLEAAQPIKAGEILTRALVRQRVLVKRGEVVNLILDGPGFRIVTQGLAVTDGRRGDTLRVLNPSSKRATFGKVEGAGIVRVPFNTAGSQP